MNKEMVVTVISGLIFGAGLTVSGMADPARVRGFLDMFSGDWDPTLAFVMGGAVIVMAIAWLIKRKLSSPLMRDNFSLPSSTAIDAPLISGAILFGIGWGVAGLCPGPALIGVIIEPSSSLIFVLSMLAGMYVFNLTRK